jgi:hypothetical protein
VVLVETHVDGSPRSVNRQQVALVREEWRVVDRWWTEQPVDRRYFDVVLATGENAVVFLDGEAQSWFSQRAKGIACDAAWRTSGLCPGVR